MMQKHSFPEQTPPQTSNQCGDQSVGKGRHFLALTKVQHEIHLYEIDETYLQNICHFKCKIASTLIINFYNFMQSCFERNFLLTT